MLKKTIEINRYDIALILIAFIWGSGFTVTGKLIEADFSAGLIIALRFTVAFIIMAIFWLGELKKMSLSEWKSGIIAGALLTGGFLFQTIALYTTTLSNSAFITATNVIMVPFICWALYKFRPAFSSFAVAFFCMIGIIVLALNSDFRLSFSFGDILSLCCAFMFAMHVAYLEGAAKNIETKKLSIVQMLTAMVFCWVFVGIFEPSAVISADYIKGALPILYLGGVCTCLCFFLQTLAQKGTIATRAAVILSTEGVFGAAISVFFGMEPLRWNMVAGGLIIFLSVVLAEKIR